MIFNETKLKNAFVIKLEKRVDKRGFFARSFCQKEFKENGLNPNLTQCNISFTKKKGTIRGLHYQVPPHQETKLVSCIKGSIYDVIVDLRPDSVTYCQWLAVKLSDSNYRMLYVPKGFAHGFQALENDTIITYKMSEFYSPKAERGIRWNDSFLKIKWPLKTVNMSEKDRNYPDYHQA